jgi:hypothetical protein
MLITRALNSPRDVRRFPAVDDILSALGRLATDALER